MRTIFLFFFGFFCLQTQVWAAGLTYNLVPQKVSDDVYAFIGSLNHFDRRNGGNIVNTGFIIGKSGVIVIDTGPSLKYGLEMREAIREITAKPVTHVVLTHHHPDHFLGNQAFKDAEILALDETIQAINIEGEGLLENMFHMVGDWMIDTEVVNANKAVVSSKMTLAGRMLQFMPLHGHTAGDLVIIDEKTGVLFAGDVLFHNRTATTPHANIDDWLVTLDKLNGASYSKVVPGHGPLENDGRSIVQTRDYLIWLKATLEQAAKDGLEMTEVMRIEKPQQFQSLSMSKVEFRRSVAHLWPGIVEKTLPQLD